jgi:iron complex outermembrane receptor protein
LNANVFYMDYQDQLILTGAINNVGAPIFTNIPESYRAGIEISALIRPAEVLEWEGTLSLSRNKARDFTAWVDNWDTWGQEAEYLGETDLAFSPSVLASSLLRYTPVDPLVLEWISQYNGKQYIDNTANAQRQLDAYWVNDLRISWTIPKAGFRQLELSLWLRNVLNEEYETNAWVYRYYYTNEEGQRREGIYDGYFPQAGRHFLFSLRMGI